MERKKSNVIMKDNILRCTTCGEIKEVPKEGMNLKEGMEKINEFIKHHKQCRN